VVVTYIAPEMAFQYQPGNLCYFKGHLPVYVHADGPYMSASRESLMSATQKNPRGSSKEGATLEVVFLATAWGPTYGGINAFNTDFARALSQILSGRVACVVLSASDADIRSASAAGVTLLQVRQSRSHSDFDASRAHDVLMALRNAGVHPAAGTWWVGHDAHTGELANEMPKASEAGKSVVIHHMSYEDYKPFMHGDAEDARRKADYQEEILRAADRAFAVGPLLLASLKEKLEPSGKYDSARMIVPGLAEIQPRHESFDVFQAITFGRLQRETDRIKQVRLAIAAFADACSVRKYPDAVPAPLQGQPRLYVYGIGRAEESQLREYAARLADRVLPFMPLPYADRESIFRKLRQTDVAMMLSWHEGFGLVGWEAISAEVPLIVTKNSGLYQLVDRDAIAGLRFSSASISRARRTRAENKISVLQISRKPARRSGSALPTAIERNKTLAPCYGCFRRRITHGIVLPGNSQRT
jgi:glycosyltransferase involved in cell wall biosynthesis